MKRVVKSAPYKVVPDIVYEEGGKKCPHKVAPDVVNEDSGKIVPP